jgi:uncharacterized protein YukE
MADQNIKVNINLDLTEFNKNAKAMSDALSKVLGKDIKMFADEMKKAETSINGAERAMGNAAKTAQKTGNSVKQSNMQWTNLALIIQDLPYGLRGIQNNIPALAAGMGGVYLAISSVVAVLTAMDMGLISFGNKVKLSTDFNKEFSSSLAEQKVKLDSLYGIATNVNRSMDDRLTAAKKLKEEYPKLLSNFSEEEIAAGKAVTAYNKLSEAVIRYAKAEAAQTAIKEIVTKQIQNDLKIAELTLQKKDANLSADKRQVEIDKKSLVYAAGTINLERVRASTIEDNITKLQKQNKTLDTQLQKYEDIYNVNATFDLEQTKTPTTAQDTSKLDLLKKQQKFYKDDLAMFYEYGELIIAEEQNLALQRAQVEGKSKDEIKRITKGFQIDMLVNQQEFGRALMAEADKNTKAYEKNEEDISKIIIKNREDIAEAIKKINSNLNDENIKNVETELQQTLRATRGSYNAQKEAYQIAIDKLKEKKAALDAAGTSTEEYRKKIENLEAGMEGLVDPLEQLNQAIQSAFNQLQIDMLTGFGEAIGDIISGEKIDMSAIGNILADAVISLGKALITYGVTQKAAIAALSSLNPIVAIAGGVLAVAAGTALKNKLKQNNAPAFANGGIVSGPTMGLVGEYPGAKSNPEVIAPLDKLKSMIGGGGGGTFVLRGQDLLLATNRAQKASNLKGQNISLA